MGGLRPLSYSYPPCGFWLLYFAGTKSNFPDDSS
jgi:hypothetical protein